MTPRKISYAYDGDVTVGDVLLTKRSAYVVVTAREMKTRDGVRRWALHCVRMEHHEVDGAGRRLSLKWFRRKPTMKNPGGAQ